MADDLDAQITGVAMLHDPIRRSLYRFVAASLEPVSRDRAAEAVGIQRPLAAFHLDKLADEGLLDVEFKRLTGRSGPGAGRPAKLYRRSSREIDVSLPPRQYDLAAHLLAAAIDQASTRGTDVRTALERAAFEFGRRLGEDAERRAGGRPSAARRREAMLEVLAEHGFEPVAVSGEVVLANCPFHSLSRQFAELVCGMNLGLMQGLRSAVSLKGGVMEPRLAPDRDRCCVRFGRASQQL